MYSFLYLKKWRDSFFSLNIGNVCSYKTNTMEIKNKNVQMMIRESFDVIIPFNQRLQPR